MKVTIIDGDDESHYTVDAVDVTPEEAKRLKTGTFVVKVNMCLKLGYTRKILFLLSDCQQTTCYTDVCNKLRCLSQKFPIFFDLQHLLKVFSKNMDAPYTILFTTT